LGVCGLSFSIRQELYPQDINKTGEMGNMLGYTEKKKSKKPILRVTRTIIMSFLLSCLCYFNIQY